MCDNQAGPFPFFRKEPGVCLLRTSSNGIAASFRSPRGVFNECKTFLNQFSLRTLQDSRKAERLPAVFISSLMKGNVSKYKHLNQWVLVSFSLLWPPWEQGPHLQNLRLYIIQSRLSIVVSYEWINKKTAKTLIYRFETQFECSFRVQWWHRRTNSFFRLVYVSAEDKPRATAC